MSLITQTPTLAPVLEDSASSTLAPVLEVFASIQGEGLHVGMPQVFLRLAGCPLRCRWCDTPGSWVVAAEPRARIDVPRERGGRRQEPGLVKPLQAAAWIAEVDPSARRALSVTGGEPLVHADFVRALKPLVSPRRVHLETGGGDPAALERVLQRVDHVSLDLKLAADMDEPVPLSAGSAPPPRSEEEWSAVRRANLALVAGRDACAKIIVAGGRAASAFAPLLDDVAELAPALALFLQPVTPMNGVRAPARGELEAVVELALARNLGVRVVPQVHRALGIP